jgi:curved DNA-binding protein CbpA
MEERFRDLQEAYSVLKDPGKRAEYDGVLAKLRSEEYYQPQPQPQRRENAVSKAGAGVPKPIVYGRRTSPYRSALRPTLSTGGHLLDLLHRIRRTAWETTMQEKTITIIIDEWGNSTLDLDGFAGKGCEKAFEDFRGGDMVKVERKKPAYHTGQVIAQEKNQR